MSDLILSVMKAMPGCLPRLAEAGLDDTDVEYILRETQRMADEQLAPLAARADTEGCALVDGRVQTPKGYGDQYRQMGEAGWLAPDLDPDYGGQGLPLTLQVTSSLPFEGAATPFMMQVSSSRSAALLLSEAAPEVAAVWSPKLASGEWTATICISEPDAGSDVGRIRTKATPEGAAWRLEGTKCWISFGDNDFAKRIGHLALARTGTPEEGTRGLSLFLVPNLAEDGSDNGIAIERIEEKLGLHGSPTCVMRFDGSKGQLIGAEGRGLPTLFGMIERMRLQVAGQGAGLALSALSLAQAYAGERRQGGRPDQKPVLIETHPDVQRMLVGIKARACALVAMLIEVAGVLEAAREGDKAAEALAPFLLPLAKNFGGEWAFEACSEAVQVFGGAGYTQEWPAERLLRDARILTIYEGTTGMQAQDFLFRRLLKDGGASLAALEAKVRAEGNAEAIALFEQFSALVDHVATLPKEAQLAEADRVLRAGWACVSAWLGARLLADDSLSDGAQEIILRAQDTLLVARNRLGLL